ncbi:hypothetical protein K8I28_02830 [bacterium]|nr:hypothetical protein [bacterium]
MMKNFGWIIIANAIIWGLVMIACAIALDGEYQKIQNYLYGGSAASLMILGGWAGAKKKRKKIEEEAGEK